MKNRLFSSLLFLLVPFVLLSQIAPSANLLPLSKVEELRLPKLDNAFLQKQNKKKSTALRFAEQRAVNIDLEKNGTTEFTSEGTMVWRQRITSPGAYSINLGFSQFKLLDGVKMYIYNIDKTEILGPFTSKDNDDHLQLWTPMIKGDQIVIELNGEPKALKKSLLELSSVNHDFLDIQNKSFSGSCNLDVACDADDGWGIVDNYRDIISSVGAFTLNGIDQCSGMLINNTANDFKPYFITANHCEISNNNAQTVVVYWNYENSTCRQPFSIQSGQTGNGLRGDFNTGSYLRASLIDSDFALIELDDPIDPSLNLYFSGWDLSGQLSDTSICIHHPAVQEKRISFDFESMIYETGNEQTPYVRVLDWDVGTTEPGSSGAPIFNAQKRFIGQLNGGLAACGNDQYDSFGFINYSWDAKSERSKSLKSWLDPLASGVESLDGILSSVDLILSKSDFELCNAITDSIAVDILPSQYFEGEVSYKVLDAPDLLNTRFQFESGHMTEENQLTITGLNNLEEGPYTIVISGSDDSNTAVAEILIIIETVVPNVPLLSMPLDKSEDLPSSVTLKLLRSTFPNYEFQVALDSNFNAVVFQEVTDDRIYHLTNLKGSTEYFWRAKAFNVCGASEWSKTYSFKTAVAYCSRFHYEGNPIEIPVDASDVIKSEIDVNYPIIIQDVNIPNIKGSHSYLRDLAFSLSFNAESVELTREICGDLHDFNFGFDDESTLPDVDCPPIDSLIYKPNEELSNFLERIGGGTWTLQVEDLAIFDGGFLESWSIEICFSEAAAAVIIPQDHVQTYCEGYPVAINCFYETQGSDDIIIDVIDRNGISILDEYVLSHNGLSQVSLIIETQSLLDITSDIQIQLKDAVTEGVLAFSNMTLVNNGLGSDVQITTPSNNQIYAIDENINFIWDDTNNNIGLLEIAFDDGFQDIVYAQTVNNSNSLILPFGVLNPSTYYVRLVNVYSCGSILSDVVSFTIDEDTNVNEVQLQEIQVYPNPSSGHFYIKSNSPFEAQTVLELYDITGKYYKPELIYVGAGLVIMNLNDLEDGLFILKIRKDDNVFQKRIYKIRN